MKKIIIFVLSVFMLAGCGKSSTVNSIDELSSKINKSKSYRLIGTMEIQNDEEVYEYDIDVSFLKDNYYKVELINKTNNHEQIILKNSDGLYVITPSLNKSFKFESTWPDNSSQGYILSSILKDIKNDKNVKTSEADGMYVIQSSVNYPNNSELKYQKVYLDKDYNIKKLEVYSDADIVKIKIEFNDVDLKAGLKESEFDLKNYILETDCEDDNCNECEGDDCKSEKTMSKLESAIYPLYMPANTYLSDSEVVNSDLDSRVILTFTGDKNFVIVEESALKNTNHEIIPVYGEPVMLNDTIGALSTNSMYWTSNDIDYYIVSDDLSVSEMVFIASSLSNARATLSEK